MIKISSIVITLLTTACIVWDATSKARTGAAKIPRPDKSLDAHGVASLGTTQSVGHVKTGENAGGGTVSTKTAGVEQGTGVSARAGTADAVVQDIAGGRVLVKTAGVRKGGGSRAGTADAVVQDIGGGRVLVKTVIVGKGAVGGANFGTADIVGQGTGGGRVLVKPVSIDKGVGDGSSVGTADAVVQDMGGGRVLVKTVIVGKGAVGSANFGTTDAVGQGAGGGRVLGKTFSIGKGTRSGATVGTAAGGRQRVGGVGTLGITSSVGQSSGGVIQDIGGSRVRVKTVTVGHGQSYGASISIAGGVGQGRGGSRVHVKTTGVEQGASNGRVRVNTVDVGQGADGDEGLSKASDEIVDSSPSQGGSEYVPVNGTAALTETPWRSANVLFAVGRPRGRKRKAKPPVVLPSCNSNGFASPRTSTTYGCVCNFVGACDKYGVPVDEAKADFDSLKGFAPKGVEAFKYGQTVTICEESTVSILFDCDGHIPLYASTVIYGVNTGITFNRKDKWKGTSDINLQRVQALYVGGNKDYEQSSCIVYCYEDGASKTFKAWNGSPCASSNTIPNVTSIDRGHMIAATYGYGHGHMPGVDGTFTYTNVVPQIGTFNRGAWAWGEKEVMKFAGKCEYNATLRKTGGKVYVVVGAIPTSFLGEPRFFGEGNFSNFQDAKRRILVPLVMWTAACCVHNDGFFDGKLAFYGWNLKIDQKVRPYDSASEMFRDMNTITWPNLIPNIVVFPNMTECN